MTDMETLREMFTRAGLDTDESDQGEALVVDVLSNDGANLAVFWFTYEGALTKVVGYGEG